jgi:hypothetical protein
MNAKSKPNGGEKIAELTPDAIKANGLNVAEHIRELGKRARIEGESVEQFAEQVASAVIEATRQVAERVGWLMENCEIARRSMETSRASLATLPDQRKAIAAPDRADNAGLEAIASELELGQQIAEPHSFIKR